MSGTERYYLIFFGIFLSLSFLFPQSFFIWPESSKSISAGFSVFFLSIYLISRKKLFFDNYIKVLLAFLFFSIVSHFANENYNTFLYISVIFLILSFLAQTAAINLGRDLGLEVLAWVCIFVCSFSLVMQFYQLQGNEGAVPYLINHLHGNRAYANIGQPNILASLYVFSIGVLVWFREVKNLSFFLFSFFIFLLAIGISFCQSRTAYLSLILICTVFFYGNFKLTYSTFIFPCVLIFCLAFPVEYFFLGEARVLSNDLSNGRFAIWVNIFDVIMEKPFIGYGVNEVARGIIGLISSDSSPYYVLFAQSHNIFLDFMVWFGVGQGLFVYFVFLAYLVSLFRRVSAGRRYVLAIFIPFFLHSHLEFPLYYLSVLVLFSFFLGVAAEESVVYKLSNNFSMFFVILFLIAALPVRVAYEMIYFEIKISEQKLYSSRIYGMEKVIIPDWYILDMPKDFIEIIGDRGESISDETAINMERFQNYYVVVQQYWRLAEFYAEKKDYKSLKKIKEKGRVLMSDSEAKKFVNYCDNLISKFDFPPSLKETNIESNRISLSTALHIS